MVPTTRRARLKAATESLHSRLDAHVDEAGFLKTMDGYRDYLLRTFHARVAVEAALDRSGAERLYPAWPARRIGDALRRDLADLELAAEAGPAPSRETMGTGAMLGALYVLEGASIGARVIARRAAALGVGPGHGARHLHAQADDAQAFRSFLEVLEGVELDERGEAECERAAIATFESFERSYGIRA